MFHVKHIKCGSFFNVSRETSITRKLIKQTIKYYIRLYKQALSKLFSDFYFARNMFMNYHKVLETPLWVKQSRTLDNSITHISAK